MHDQINSYLLVILLISSSYFDLKERRIPNLLTLPVILWGVITSTIFSGLSGFQFSILGFLFGVAVFFIPFALNALGAGDVKLMGAIGALMGWKFTLSAVLYTALAGGGIVLLVSVYNRKFFRIVLSTIGFIVNPLLNFLYIKTLNKQVLKIKLYMESFKLDKKKEYIPYGVAIALGTLMVLSGIVRKVV